MVGGNVLTLSSTEGTCWSNISVRCFRMACHCSSTVMSFCFAMSSLNAMVLDLILSKSANFHTREPVFIEKRTSSFDRETDSANNRRICRLLSRSYSSYTHIQLYNMQEDKPRLFSAPSCILVFQVQNIQMTEIKYKHYSVHTFTC